VSNGYFSKYNKVNDEYFYIISNLNFAMWEETFKIMGFLSDFADFRTSS